MKKKRLKISEMTDEQRLELLSQRRIKVLAKYIRKHYANNEDWIEEAKTKLDLIVHYEIIKGLDEEFDILRDDPNDPLILDLIDEQTALIIEELLNFKVSNRKN